MRAVDTDVVLDAHVVIYTNLWSAALTQVSDYTVSQISPLDTTVRWTVD